MINYLFLTFHIFLLFIFSCNKKITPKDQSVEHQKTDIIGTNVDKIDQKKNMELTFEDLQKEAIIILEKNPSNKNIIDHYPQIYNIKQKEFLDFLKKSNNNNIDEANFFLEELQRLTKKNKVIDFINSMEMQFGKSYIPSKDPDFKPYYKTLIEFNENEYEVNIIELLDLYKRYFVNYNDRETLQEKLKKGIYARAKEYNKIENLKIYEIKMKQLMKGMDLGCFWDPIYEDLGSQMNKKLKH